MLISVLLATYNWPKALSLCLDSLNAQTDRHFEIILCDDGSTEDTKQLIETYQNNFSVPIKHLWHEDKGFRKTIILNQGIQAAQGEYLVFLDGDCIVQNDFIAQHRLLAESGHLVTGSRILLSEKLTAKLSQSTHWSNPGFVQTLTWVITGAINKFLPLWLKLPDGAWRLYKQFEWRRIKGCNMACWKSDALSIDGFDENLIGWGHEDADFVFRLQAKGVVRKSGAWATEVFHLWHKIMDRSQAEKNAAVVREKILAKVKQAYSHAD